MWWIFPQAAGLGHSARASEFAIRDLEEARAFLAHPVLGPRLAEAVHVARAQAARVPLRTLVGGQIDCTKLVSSLTLFARVGRTETSAADLVVDAEAVLLIAAEQGFPRCAFSERFE